MAALMTKISALGNAVSQHHFAGTYNGYAAVLYTADSELGTHYVALINNLGRDDFFFPVMIECVARDAFSALISNVHAEQKEQDAA